MFLFSSNLYSQTFNTTGTWTCPYNVYFVEVQMWGPGGNGSTRTSNGGGGGGGGGAFVRGTVPVVPGTTYTVTVGTPGNDTWFINTTTILAKAGNSVANNTTTGGTGGLASACVVPSGGVAFDGGSGFTSAGQGGGGGAGAGTINVGASATSGTGATGTNGGGNGGNGRTGSQGNGSDGSAPGGGGGGGYRTSSGTRNGGTGANGRVILNPIPTVLDLVLTKTVNNMTPNVGDNIIFTLTASNAGPDDAVNVNVIDQLPDGYLYVSDDGGVSTTENFGLINWNIGSFPSGSNATLNITVQVLPPGNYQNTAKIFGTYVETSLVNNQSSITPAVNVCGAGYSAPVLIKN